MAFNRDGMLKLLETFFVYDAGADAAATVAAEGYFNPYRFHLKQYDLVLLVTENGTKGDLVFVSSETHASPVTLATSEGVTEDAGGGPEWLPEGATTYGSFENGNYYANGAETTLAALVDEDTNWGSWDGTSSITDGQFAVMPAAMLGDAITEGATIVFEWTAGTGYILIEFIDLPSYNSEMGINASDPVLLVQNTIEEDPNTSYEFPSSEPGNHKTAVTISPTVLAVSDNGRAVSSIVNDSFGPFTHLGFGADGDAVLKSITILPPQLDAALPALSAL